MSKTVSFDGSAPGGPPLISGSSTARSSRGLEMPPDVARSLSESGATLLLLDFPVGAEFGIDLCSWNTGERFKGVKMIPPGVHFVHWSSVSRVGGAVGPRTGFFKEFKRGELVVRRFCPETEDVVEDVPEQDVARMRGDLRNLDRNLGPYPYDEWKRWVSLTDKISSSTLSRLEPINGKVQSVTELVPEKHFTSRRSRTEQSGSTSSTEPMDEAQTSSSSTSSVSPGSKRSAHDDDQDHHSSLGEDAKLPRMRHQPGTEIRYTSLPTAKYPPGATPQEITRHSMDAGYRLEQYLLKFKNMYGDPVSSSMARLNQSDEVLGELQFSFVCFLVGQHYDSFEHWKRLTSLLCECGEGAVKENEGLYLTLLGDMHFQIKEVPNDFFVDIVSNNNFLVTVLSRLFQTLKSAGLDSKLRSRAGAFQASLSRKFGWDFDQDLEDEAPVVVDLGEAS